MKHARLITVLVFAAMLLILGLLVANATSFSSLPDASAQPVPTGIAPDGTIYHPYHLDDPGPYLETWTVNTEGGTHQWLVNPMVVTNIKPLMYIMHNSIEYQVSGIDRKALTMSAVLLGN